MNKNSPRNSGGAKGRTPCVRGMMTVAGQTADGVMPCYC